MARWFVWDLKIREVKMEQRMGREADKAERPGRGRRPEENEARVVGRLVNTPKVTEVQGPGGPVKLARFTLAVNRSYRDSAGRPCRETSFIPVVAWRSLAETAGEMGKGSALRIGGRIKTWEVEGKKYRWEIQANTLEALDARTLGRGENEPAQQKAGREAVPA